MDNALNYTTSTAVYFVTVDTTPPPAVSLLGTPLNNLTTNQMTLNFSWGASTDIPAGLANYILEVSTDPAFGIINYSSWVVLNQASLTLNQSSYTWRVNAMDNALNYTTSTVKYFVTVDTTPPAVPALSPLNGTVTSQMNITFTAASDDSGTRGNSGIASYEFDISTAPDFSVITTSQSQAGSSLTRAIASGIYFWHARALDNAGNYSGYSSNYSLTIDTSGPMIHDNQANVTQWQNYGNMLYNVAFEDDLALLNNVGYSVYSSSTVFNLSTQLVGWTAIAQNINASTYTNNFTINFNALPQNTTCYVAVSAANNLLEATTFYNAFFVLKDTTSPSINDTQSGDNTWRSINNGTYSVGFGNSGGSGLQLFDTRVMSGPLGSGTLIEDWTANANSALIANTTYYNTPWPLNSSTWNNMPQGQSYVSVRVFNNSYSTALGYSSNTMTDAFYVLKDTTPPVVIDNQSGDAA
jgi:hypothetical protein